VCGNVSKGRYVGQRNLERHFRTATGFRKFCLLAELLALTSPTSDGRSVGIVTRTRATEFVEDGATRSSEPSVLTRPTQRHIPEDGILESVVKKNRCRIRHEMNQS
jgi:hypothetical protein